MRGLGRRIRFLVIASVVAAAADLVTGGPTYRPSVHALGWTPAGELVFVHQEETGGYDYRRYACGGSGVYVLRRRGPHPLVTGRRWCGGGDGPAHHRFTLSSDGRRLFASSPYSFDDCGTVQAMDLPRGAWSRFYHTCATNLSDAVVSPDGRTFVARRTCSQLYGGGEPPRVLPAGCVAPAEGRLRVFSADGSGERPIGGAKHHDPVWSPDARSLLAVDQGRGVIVHLDVATGAERVLARGGDPAWSPDGRWIAFIRHEERPDRPGASLRVIRADGTGERTIFLRWYGPMWNMETRPNGIPQSPLWSPDGRRIVFARYHNRGHTLWRISAEGTGLRRLARPIEPGE
jgi:hypothetical protein